MKFYSYLIFLLPFLFGSCSDDEIDKVEGGSGSKIVWKSVVSVPESEVSGEAQTREYGGNTTGDDLRPVDYYPLDKMYLAIPRTSQARENSSPAMGEDGDYFFLPVSVGQRDQTTKSVQSFDVQLEIEEGEQTLSISSGTERYDHIQPGKGFFFVSLPTLQVALTPTGSTTPGGKPTYQPYGDHLFKSTDYSFTIEEGQIVPKKALSLNNFIPIDLKKESVIMRRVNSIWTSKLIVTDYYYEKEYEDDFDISPDVQAAFKSHGRAQNWTSRVFLMDYPLEYNLRYDISTEKPIGRPMTSPTGVVAYSESDRAYPFKSNSTQMTIKDEEHPNDGIQRYYYGYGHFISNSSFIFNVPQLEHRNIVPAKMCLEITAPNGVRKTLIVEPEEDLPANMNVTYTVLIHYDDFFSAFYSDYERKHPVTEPATKGVNFAAKNSDWEDDILDIPYKLVVTKSPVMEKIEK